MSPDELRQQASAPCGCKELARELNIPLVNGHCVLRRTDLLHRVFGKSAPCLLQNMTNEVLPSWENRHNIVLKCLRRVCQGVILDDVSCDRAAPALYSECLSRVKLW